MDKTFSQVIKEEAINNVLNKDRTYFLYGLLTDSKIIDNNYVLLIRNEKIRNEIINLFKTFKRVNINLVKTNLYFNKEEVDELTNEFCNDMSLPEMEVYIAGMFVARGYINHPGSKYYHFELRISTIESTINIVDLLSSIGIKSSFLEKNG
jgi:DNA-binding transcriptional regulator WhiA